MLFANFYGHSIVYSDDKTSVRAAFTAHTETCGDHLISNGYTGHCTSLRDPLGRGKDKQRDGLPSLATNSHELTSLGSLLSGTTIGGTQDQRLEKTNKY